MALADTDLLHTVQDEHIAPSRAALGRALVWGAALLLAGLFAWQATGEAGWHGGAFGTWRPVLYAYLGWAVALCVSRVLIHGESGRKALFVLPATLFVVSMVVFPLLFGLWIAFSDWNLSSLDGRRFNGTANLVQMWNDPFYWNALWNMVLYVAAILVEYVIAFGLALLLNADIRARKFWRVAFLLPLMLSPVAVSWMIGKSMLENRFGPIAKGLRELGFERISFFSDPEIARAMIMIMDAWTFIPFMMIMLLAGLQAMPKEVLEAADVDGATPWQRFWGVTFPLMLPVSVTAIMIRVIFKLKLADIVINVTAGGPGGATDTVTSFIYREYRDRSNVGYGTMLAMVYLVLIVVFMTILLKISDRIVARATGQVDTDEAAR